MKQDVDAVILLENKDKYYMSLALKEALRAKAIGEVPVGCVIVYDDKIIARGYNKREKMQLSLAHAEIVAIKKACKKLGSWRLNDATMYVTLEPCMMCAGAILQSRIKRLVYGAYDYRFGAHISKVNLFDVRINHHTIVTHGVLNEECSNIIKDFFKELRIKKA